MPGSPHAYAIVFLLVVAFILHGSLYPFQFHTRATTTTGPLAYLWSTWHDWDHRADPLSNILQYIPFGFFGACTFGWRLALPVTLAGAALAAGVELAQFYNQGRVTSMGDVYADTIGAGVGAIAATLAGSGLRWPQLKELSNDPPATMVLPMWFGFRLYPYVPVTSRHKYVRALAPIVINPTLAPIDLIRFTTAWTCIGAILDALHGSRRVLVLLPLPIVAELARRILIIDTALKLADIAGAGLAVAIWLLPLCRAGVVRLVIVIARLQPFTFDATPRAFGWVPFTRFLRGSIGVAIQAFCEKFFQYGGLIWLPHRLGLSIGLATALIAALLFATSWLEAYVSERSAEITDATMAVVIGGVFALFAHRHLRPS